jgi:hypothetical protein
MTSQMRASIFCIAIALAVACTGHKTTVQDAPMADSMRTCTGAAYDPCTTATQCTSMNCHDYKGSMLQVCTEACTPGDSSTCPIDNTGSNGFCNNMGTCKPAAANSCTP